MKTKLLLTAFIFSGLSFAFFACQKMEDSVTPTPVSLTLPATTYDYTHVNSGGTIMSTGVDNDVATLGRVLFYDTHLSINNSISCGTCHKQTMAFSDDLAFSAGFENHPTLRNTLPIQNISNNQFNSFINPSLFGDGRATLLQSMVLMPMMNHVEMGMSDLNDIVEKVRNLPYYNQLFSDAFFQGEINIANISTALSTFVGCINSGDTKFDRANNNLVQLSAMESEGRALFFTKYNCNSCHQTQELNGYQQGGGFVNIGLDEIYTDKGHENVTHDVADNGKFKIPNLRNIALTAPYMHDGRFNNLNEVLNHYSHGIKNSPALDPRLKSSSGQPMEMNITDHEKTALIAFLNTLTDFSMVTDPKFSNPFKKVL
jgi:cytochrome c peroxidase